MDVSCRVLGHGCHHVYANRYGICDDVRTKTLRSVLSDVRAVRPTSSPERFDSDIRTTRDNHLLMISAYSYPLVAYAHRK